MRIRAYVAIAKDFQTIKPHVTPTSLEAKFIARLEAAIAKDPQETTPIDVPWEEWEAWTKALYRYGGPEIRRAMRQAG